MQDTGDVGGPSKQEQCRAFMHSGQCHEDVSCWGHFAGQGDSPPLLYSDTSLSGANQTCSCAGLSAGAAVGQSVSCAELLLLPQEPSNPTETKGIVCSHLAETSRGALSLQNKGLGSCAARTSKSGLSGLSPHQLQAQGCPPRPRGKAELPRTVRRQRLGGEHGDHSGFPSPRQNCSEVVGDLSTQGHFSFSFSSSPSFLLSSSVSSSFSLSTFSDTKT